MLDLEKQLEDLQRSSKDTDLDFTKEIKGIIQKKFLPQSVVKVRINEIDMYLNGKNKYNFEIEKVKYNKNINEPGSGAN